MSQTLWKLACLSIMLSATLISASGQDLFHQQGTWKTFSPTVDGFSVSLPVDMLLEGKADAAATRKYYANSGGNYYYVFSETFKNRTCSKFIDSFAKSNGKEISIERTAETIYKVSFVDVYGFFHNVIALRALSRIYIAQTVSEKENDPDVAMFLSSFSLGRNTKLPIESPITPKIQMFNQTVPNAVPPGAVGSSNQGETSGGIVAQPSPTPAPIGETRPFRLLTKPKSAYTDFARFYLVEGYVELRVTLLANGKIGSVTVTKKLPFGLTNQAIDAAKLVTFEPAMANGVPKSVIKTFQYQFTIF